MGQLKTSLRILGVMTLLLGIIYPLFVTGSGMLLFPEKARGSLVSRQGYIAGSEVIGQMFTSPKFFHGRPSANDFDGTNSGGTNLGPTNGKLAESVARIADAYRKENELAADVKIPAEMIYSSGSGLDPHISVEAAMMQACRIARARGVSRETVADIVWKNVERSYFGLFGDLYVNVLKLNLALEGQ